MNPAVPPRATADPVGGAMARRLADYLRSHRARRSVLGGEYLSDPAWDMLLDLFDRELSGRTARVADACRAAGVPPSTALRWVDVLASDGLIVRAASDDHPAGARLSLSIRTRRALHRWLDDAALPLSAGAN